MGYYDDFDQKPVKPRNNPFKWISVIVLSALVGSGATLLTVPTIMKSQLSAQPAQQTLGGVTTAQNVQVKVNDGIVQAVNKVKPAVVGVVNLQKSSDIWSGKTSQQPTGVGSGVLFDNQGHIITNNHVVEGATEVEVVIQDKTIKAKVIGTDQITDLAVLQVPLDQVKGIQPAQLGNSDNLQIGEPAIAIGNPLGLKFAQTVTTGVISSTNRTLPVDQNGQTVYEQSFLQTDAAINPGNSGGALVNIEGQVIGINSAKISSAGVEGLGFAIPINEAKPIVEQLMANGKIIRPALGVGVQPIDQIPDPYRSQLPVQTGLYVVQSTGAAKTAGIQKGDIIVKVDNTDVKTFIDLRKYLFTKKPGDTVKVSFYHDKQEKTVNVTLGTLN